MDPAVERSSSTRSTQLYSDTPTQSSGDFEPAEVRAMLSEMSGTPLPLGSTWDAEAIERLKSFQRSEALPATGNLDTVTAQRLSARFEQIAAARHAASEGSALRLDSPTPAEHDFVKSLAHGALHAAEHLASQFAPDAPIRAAYVKEARELSETIVSKFESGELTAGEAASAANRLRNAALNEARQGLSPAGVALSKYLKEEGVSLAELFQKYSSDMYGKAIRQLTADEWGAISVHIAKRAGITHEAVNTGAKLAPALGKVLFAATIAIAIYQVASAEDKVHEAAKQGGALVGFLAGAKAGAAIGGVACAAGGVSAPATPACAVVGSLIGGIVGMMAGEAAADRGYVWIKG